MTTETYASRRREPAMPGQLIAGIGLGYVIAAVLMVTLVLAGGVWNQLANTRLLSMLIEGGVVRYHDKQIGPIPGVPELKYYVMSQDPVTWLLVLFAAALMFGYWAVKSIQFGVASRALGSTARLGEDARAYLYGQGVNRWLPYHMGDLAAAVALSAREGDRPEQDRFIGTIYLGRCFTVFEIAFFGLLGLFFLGWGDWLALLFWPLVIAVAAYFMLRQPGTWRAGMNHSAGWRTALAWFQERPLLTLFFALLSIVAFLLEHIAVYALSQAFSSANVLLNIEFSVFLMALVAGMIARIIPITPGGIGQFEWGFATAIYLAGTGMPEAVTMALLFAVLRYGVGFLITAGMRLSQGLPITLREVLQAVRVDR